MRGINFAIAMGLALLLPMLITYGINLLHPPPQHDDYYKLGYPGPGPVSEEEFKERERISQQERDAFNAARESYQQTFFYVALPIGVLLIIGGSLLKIASIGNGFVFGGVFTLVWGYYYHWANLSDLLKFISLLIAVGLLIFTAFRAYTRSQREVS